MKSGFTLVELLIVITIMAILVTAMTGALNPAALVDRAHDASRKKDVNRIKVAFEEYYNDNGCYPNATVVAALSDPANCDRNIALFPQLRPWVCDPVTNKTYVVVVEPSNCPRWYKIMAKLANRSDSDIPSGWSALVGYHIGSTDPNQNYDSQVVNYGVSSGNVGWTDYTMACPYKTDGTNSCNVLYANGDCKSVGQSETCTGSTCYAGPNCLPQCQVECCPSINGRCN